MTRIYSSITGQYLGIIYEQCSSGFDQIGIWCAEDRNANVTHHALSWQADAWLRKQESFDAVA